MKKYLVGGAVRDKLLGLTVSERDWVVVGSTPLDLLALGYRSVGKDFPVFLHPVTREEYALARTERKTGPGYHGFQFNAHPDVTLEQDLLRRDLTINAIAEDSEGRLIDPYGGQRDINQKILRHVSPAFAEDPVRILRLARFAARFAPLGFRVADETRTLMKQMVLAGEVDALVPERIFSELAKALAEPEPWVFFEVLRDCGADAVLFPEIHDLFGVPQSPRHHPEIDTGIHTMLVLKQSVYLSADPVVRFSALTHDLGKAVTPKERWPKHRGHEKAGMQRLQNLCDRLKTPRAYRDLAEKVMRYHGHCHSAMVYRPGIVVDLLQRLDAYRKPDTLAAFLLACQADSEGRPGYENVAYPQRDWLLAAREAAVNVGIQPLLQQGLKGAELGKALRLLRVDAVRARRQQWEDRRRQQSVA